MLLHNKIYKRLFIASVVNGIGDRFNQVAVLALLLQLTGSGVAVGAALAVRIVPYLFFSPLGGWLASRFHARTVLSVMDFIRIAFALTLLLVDSGKDLWVVYGVLFLLAASEAVYQPVRRTCVTRSVDEGDLLSVNRLEQMLLGLVLIFGSAVGGFVSFWVSPQAVFIINAATFAIAAFLLMFIPENAPVSTFQKNSLLKTVQTGWWAIVSHPLLKKLFIIDAMISLGEGMFNVLISIYAYQKYQMGDLGIGLLYGALGVGLMLNKWVPIKRGKGLMAIAIVTIMTEGVFQLVVSQIDHFTLTLIFFILISLSGGISRTAMDTMLMKQLEVKDHGPVYSLTDMTSNVIMGLSMFGTGFLVQMLSIELVGGIASILFILVACVSFGFGLFEKKKVQEHSLFI